MDEPTTNSSKYISKTTQTDQEEDSSPECMVCYKDLNTKSVTQFKPCLHKMCFQCASQIKKKSELMRCPYCRTWIDNKEPEEIEIAEERPRFRFEEFKFYPFCFGILYMLTFAGLGAAINFAVTYTNDLVFIIIPLIILFIFFKWSIVILMGILPNENRIEERMPLLKLLFGMAIVAIIFASISTGFGAAIYSVLSNHLNKTPEESLICKFEFEEPFKFVAAFHSGEKCPNLCQMPFREMFRDFEKLNSHTYFEDYCPEHYKVQCWKDFRSKKYQKFHSQGRHGPKKPKKPTLSHGS